ncbi:ANTAR domain-containing protein, partial [Kitasatospora purpeofusca]|uniref:ANTAR domain-containing protein n=1 Tax=Kitasatospora purpeofusca TaxID=67352 RepID=UPI003661BC2A
MSDGPRPGGPPGVPPYGAGPAAEPAGGPGSAQGAVARQLAGAVRRLQRTVERMRAEEGARAVVDLATGMLAERLTVSPAEAAARLAALAREAGVPVATLAADIVGRTAGAPARD